MNSVLSTPRASLIARALAANARQRAIERAALADGGLFFQPRAGHQKPAAPTEANAAPRSVAAQPAIFPTP